VPRALTAAELLGHAYTARYQTDDEVGGVFGPDLAGYAAYDAARTLAQNWQDATHDGVPLADVLHDVDDVVALLQEWRRAVRARFVPAGG
jgi:hypothetical protein